jgi:hypothetical protein
LTNYDMITGLAPMIREVVPHAAHCRRCDRPALQAFSNDRGLSSEQARTLVHWIEAGAPRGTGADPLARAEEDWPECRSASPT